MLKNRHKKSNTSATANHIKKGAVDGGGKSLNCAPEKYAIGTA
jgi:hypothetical protein